jgi:hypothetical protein
MASQARQVAVLTVAELHDLGAREHQRIVRGEVRPADRTDGRLDVPGNGPRR